MVEWWKGPPGLMGGMEEIEQYGGKRRGIEEEGSKLEEDEEEMKTRLRHEGREIKKKRREYEE